KCEILYTSITYSMFVDLFIGKIYATFQAASAVVGVAVAAAVMVGIDSPSAVKYIEGGLIIFCGIMGASGAWGSRLLAKAIGDLRVENSRYAENNDEHQRLNKVHEEENMKYSEENEKLAVENNELTENNNKLEVNLNVLSKENDKMNESLANLSRENE